MSSKKKRKWYSHTRLIILVLLILSLWQFGSGLYIHAKAQLAQVLLHQAWNKTLQGQQRVKPWSWADTWPVARLKFPRFRKDLIVLAGDTGRTLAFGPGYRFGTATPGQPGNTMISAHRDTHFRFLRQVRRGDTFSVQDAKGGVRVYRIRRLEVMHKNRARLATGNDRSIMTLVTCYPFDAVTPGGPLRYVVTAYEVKIAATAMR